MQSCSFLTEVERDEEDWLALRDLRPHSRTWRRKARIRGDGRRRIEPALMGLLRKK